MTADDDAAAARKWLTEMSADAREAMQKRTAIHEAGHAVMHLYLGLGCREVTIVPNPEELSSGAATHGGEWGEGDEDVEALRAFAEDAFFLRHAIACYAGAEALHQCGFTDWQDGAEQDEREAVDYIASITSDAQCVDLLHRYARRRTELLVAHYLPEIEALAKALLEAQTIEKNEVQRIVTETRQQRGGALWRW
jgi:hypothetical protein